MAVHAGPVRARWRMGTSGVLASEATRQQWGGFDDTDTVMQASTCVHDRQCIRNHHDTPEHPVAQAITVWPKDGKVFTEVVQQLVCT